MEMNQRATVLDSEEPINSNRRHSVLGEQVLKHNTNSTTRICARRGLFMAEKSTRYFWVMQNAQSHTC